MSLIIGSLALMMGCASNQSTALCAKTLDITGLFYELSNGSDMIGAMTSTEVRNDIDQSLYALDAIDEKASDNIKDRTQQVRSFFLELSTALDEVEWDVAVAVTDSRVQSLLAKSSDKALGDAVIVVNEYRQSICDVAPTIPLGVEPLSTMPFPEQPSPTATDPSMGVTDNASDVRATGVTVATLFGLTITDEQVDCLGAALQGIVDVSSSTASLEQYQGQFQKAFDECAIDFEVPKN